MKCLSSKKEVKIRDCEECLSKRLAKPICFKRRFIWGIEDSQEPRWVLNIKEAQDSKEDVSQYYDKKWEGNQHLTQDIIVLKNKKEIIPNDIRWAIWERDNFTCKLCGTRKYLSIDHIYPECKGGLLEISNLQTLCRSCNSRKGGK